MKTNIFDRLKNACRLVSGTIDLGVPLYGEWDVKVTRADGRVESKVLRNVITAEGFNRIANRAVQAAGTTPFFTIIVGSINTAAAITDDQAQFGEMIRKPFIGAGASAQSREWIFGACTIQGAADGMTGLAMACAGITDFATSHATTGIYANRVVGLGVTLADSDYLNLTVRIRVGSHNQSHTT